jgi:hypothetical protein
MRLPPVFRRRCYTIQPGYFDKRPYNSEVAEITAVNRLAPIGREPTRNTRSRNYGPVVDCAYGYQKEAGKVEKEGAKEKGFKEESAKAAGPEESYAQKEASQEECGSEKGDSESKGREPEEGRTEKDSRTQKSRSEDSDLEYGSLRA